MATIAESLKKIWKSIQKSPTFSGAVLYGWFCLIGMLYARSYYQPFGIDIFNFAEPLDFLLITISKAGVVFSIVFSLVLILVLLTVIFLFLPSMITFIIFWIIFIISWTAFIIFWTAFITILFLSSFLLIVILLLRLLAKFTKSCILSAYYILIGSPVAWDVFVASRREWKTFTASFRAALDTFADSGCEWKKFTAWLDTAGKKLTAWLNTAGKKLTAWLNTAGKKLTAWLNTAKNWYHNIREKWKLSFWRSLYPFVAVMLILFTFFWPSCYGEQKARTLVSESINQVGKIPVVSPIYSMTSDICSQWLNCLQGIFLDASPENNQQKRPVRVTIRQDALQPKTRLPIPDHTFLLGTTSSFHFFYECENASKAEVCKNGRPFIIPTANIASLEFIQAGEVPGDIVATITKLDIIIGNLKSEKIEITDAITQINAIITSINMSSETRTELMIPKIASPKQEIVTRLSPDEIATVAIALKSYLEGNIPGTHLNETIKNLEDLPDSDLAQIAEAIENLSIPGGQSHCAYGWRKVATIGPFPIGDHDQLEETARECQNQLIPPDQFVNEMSGHFTNQQPLLIGRVDITQLSEQARKDYGSDSGLAQARAKWVRDELVKKFKNEERKEALKRAILLSAGPLHVGENVSDCDRALDRSVEVYACWTPKPKPEQAAAPPAPAETSPATTAAPQE